jgi:dienelactone hydrolase
MRLKIFTTTLLVIACFIETLGQKDTIPDSKYYPVKGESKNVVIMLLGGSEGGLPNYYNIDRFTKLGYPCFIIGYFGTKNTPNKLEMIPLEYFEDAIKTIKSQSDVANKKIVVYGGSKGGELALLLASRYKQIEAVIASVPSCVVFQGIGGRRLSSWSFNNEPIPFVPYAPFDFSKIVNSQYVELYRLSLEQTEAVEKATIQVENINGPILLLSGKEDTMWPSNQMGEMIVKRLVNYKFPHWYKHISYDNAGHTLNEQHMMGGTLEGNKQARIDSEQRILEFLNRLSNRDI